MLSLHSDVFAPLMALLGVGLSALVSLVLSGRTARVEIQKLYSQFQQVYAAKLIERRVETYPELYSYLSDFSKLALGRVPSHGELKLLQGKVDSWDSKNAIFLGRKTVNVCYDFRMELSRAIASAADEALARDSTIPEWLPILRRQNTRLQLGLRGDIGVYIGAVKGLPDIFDPPLEEEWVRDSRDRSDS